MDVRVEGWVVFSICLNIVQANQDYAFRHRTIKGLRRHQKSSTICARDSPNQVLHACPEYLPLITPVEKSYTRGLLELVKIKH